MLASDDQILVPPDKLPSRNLFTTPDDHLVDRWSGPSQRPTRASWFLVVRLLVARSIDSKKKVTVGYSHVSSYHQIYPRPITVMDVITPNGIPTY